MPKKSADRAGVANEAGSVHRRGVAVFLAVHGLCGTQVLGGVPRFLQFETEHKTDDILCVLDTDRRLFISAKRTCGATKAFRETVKDWASTPADAGDRLVLATAEPKGDIRYLDAALSRRRDSAESVFPADQKRALKTLTDELVSVDTVTRDKVIEAAAVLVVDGRSRNLLCAMLEGTVVPPGHGPQTVSHLEALLHTQAGAAYSGDLNSWREYLAALNVPFLPGVAGSSHAEWMAVTHYRAALAARLGEVDLNLLADDLEPLVIPELVEGIQVVRHTADPEDPRDTSSLKRVARRVTRLLIEGLPGSGKSAAVVQLAALWAGDFDAPLPVLVRLKDLARRCSDASDVSVDLLCELAAAGKPDLSAGFQTVLARGHAVLLLDGLDECLEQAPVIAQGLKRVISQLPAQTGVVVTTRPGSTPAAHRLGLHPAELAAPRDLDSVLAKLFEHVAKARVAENRPGWIADRIARLNAVRSSHRDIGAVPLLSILVALTIADDRSAPLRTTTAGVLNSAIEQTITRWEHAKDSLPAGYRVRPTEGQLLTAFGAIGWLLSRQPIAASSKVLDAVADALRQHWGLPIAEAVELARAAVWFWDVRNGVFVTGLDGRVTARSRVFAEIGAAQWCRHLDAQDLNAWVEVASGDETQHVALLLASQTDVRVSPLLRDHPQLAFQALRDGADFAEEQIAHLLGQLCEAARAAASQSAGKAGRSTAPVLQQIAELPVSGALHASRVEVLQSLELPQDERVSLLAIAAMASASAEYRRLNPSDVDDVMAMLSLPLPPRSEQRSSVRRGIRRYRAGVTLPSRMAPAVVLASNHVDDLPEPAVELIRRLIPRMSARDASETVTNLLRQGYEAGLNDSFGQVLTTVRDGYRELVGDFQILLEFIGELSPAAAELGEWQRWRLPTVNGLFHALRFPAATDLHDVVTLCSPELVKTWLTTAALAAGLDIETLAAEARHCLANSVEDEFSLATVSLPREDRTLNVELLDQEARLGVVVLLTSDPEWIAETAVEILWGHVDPAWFSAVASLIPKVAPLRRRRLASLAISLSSDTAAQAAAYFASSDSPLRCAGAEALADNDPLRSKALVDADITVRHAAGATADSWAFMAADYWSCPRCASMNETSTPTCTVCGNWAGDILESNTWVDSVYPDPP
ncbi:NACHT domain-containing protein [Amycolatopsis sp. NPDC003731]